MTVGQLIEELQKHDSSLPVCLADWNEEHALDAELLTVGLECGRYAKGAHGNCSEEKSDYVLLNR